MEFSKAVLRLNVAGIKYRCNYQEEPRASP